MNEKEIVQRWNQRFLYLFWLALLLYLVLALIAGWMQPATGRANLLVHTMVYPGIGLLLIVAMLDLARRRYPAKLPVFLMAGTYVAVYVIASALYALISPVTLLALPVMFSTVYLRKDVVVVSTGVSLVEFAVLYVQIYRHSFPDSPMDFLVFVGVLIVVAGVALLIVGRGQELAESLTQNVEARQELIMQNVWMQRMSKFDALTALYNRTALQDHVARLVEVCGKHDISLHMAILDIDDFKQINDSFGHDVGDEVLKHFSLHLATFCKDEFFVARYGGEEFVIVATEMSEDTFISRMEQLRQSIPLQNLSGHQVTISIGVQSYRQGESADSFFRAADQGLYWSKNHGKNRVGFLGNQELNLDNTLQDLY